jgi:hypothetical protein
MLETKLAVRVVVLYGVFINYIWFSNYHILVFLCRISMLAYAIGANHIN